MVEKIETLGEFIASVVDEDEQWKWKVESWLFTFGGREVTREAWEDYLKLSLTRGAVIDFAGRIAAGIARRLVGILTQGLYNDSLREGHAFLQKIYQKAIEWGVDVQLEEIDKPITPTERLVAVGYATIDKEGRVMLTEEGERVAKEIVEL